MSFTVVIKNNENGKILFASENTKVFVIGAVAAGKTADNSALSLAACDASTVDMAVAVSLARAAIEGVEKDDPDLKMLGPIADAFVADMNSKQSKKEDSEND
ncbi:MAG: hypothetical protein II319_05070 [Clostridia bacterium]|nr:hypothetical protein [Clostridia bacterium]